MPCVQAAVWGLVCLEAWFSTATAVQIPYEHLFHGNPQTLLIRDLDHYPNSFLSVESEYWDLYYERRGGRYQDYHHSTQSVLNVTRWGSLMGGVTLGRAALTLEQDNLYTDSDRLRGQREDIAGKAILGIESERRYPLGVTAVELIGAAGWREGFAGDMETEVRWVDRATLRLQAQTFGSLLEIDEDINGFCFPFRFPFRTERYRGSFQITPEWWRVKAWGDAQWHSGDGEPESGFANQLWYERTEWGIVLSRRVAEFHRFHPVARLTGGSRPFGFRLAVSQSSGMGDVAMYFEGTRYLHLDDLKTTTTSGRVDLAPFTWLSVFGGVDELRVRHEGRSFFDPWPFYIWDVFIAKRYRLADLDLRMKTWYLGVGSAYRGRRLDVELSGRFEWWGDTNSLTFLERKDILFPFFFEYEPHGKGVDVPFRYAIQIDPAVVWRVTDHLAARLQARAMVPFGRAEVRSTEAQSQGGGDSVQPGPAEDRSKSGRIEARRGALKRESLGGRADSFAPLAGYRAAEAFGDDNCRQLSGVVSDLPPNVQLIRRRSNDNPSPQPVTVPPSPPPVRLPLSQEMRSHRRLSPHHTSSQQAASSNLTSQNHPGSA
jgi:hypothetical protein